MLQISNTSLLTIQRTKVSTVKVKQPSLKKYVCDGFFPPFNKMNRLWVLFGFNNTQFLLSITVLIHFHGNLLLPL